MEMAESGQAREVAAPGGRHREALSAVAASAGGPAGSSDVAPVSGWSEGAGSAVTCRTSNRPFALGARRSRFFTATPTGICTYELSVLEFRQRPARSVSSAQGTALRR